MLALLAILQAPSAAAETTVPNADVPPKVGELLDLLADPTVQGWIAQHRSAAADGSAPASAAGSQTPLASAGGTLALRLEALRDNFRALIAELPRLPEQLDRAAATLRLEFEKYGPFATLILVLAFVLLGAGAEWLYHRASRRLRSWIVNLPFDTGPERLRVVLIRLAYSAGTVAVFAIGSIGAFLLLHWPPLLREIGLGYLVAFLALRLALVAGRFVLAPGDEYFRILPMSNDAAKFWFRRSSAFVGWLAFGWVTVGLLQTLGLPTEGCRIIAYGLGLGLLAIGIEAVWRQPIAIATDERSHDTRRLNPHVSAWLYSIYFVVLWLLWVAHAVRLFWLAVVIVGLPIALRLTERAVNHVMRRETSSAAVEVSTIRAVALEHGLRAILIIGAALLLARAWNIDLVQLTAADSPETRLVRGLIGAVIIALVADFCWRVLCAVIDHKLAEVHAGNPLDSEEARRRARLKTLLPIVRNMLSVVIVVMVVLMILAAMGVEIGPLIAGAGVVGVAIGFGAQTVVKDIISGMFYLLDDAFRVGEYIQSGQYKGTVESFSLRSVKLRHHRGPLFTVPFGELGAVQNMSRDWVIDKLSLSVTYDTDLDKARKLIKRIGSELKDDPQFGQYIMETLKMQGVEQFGEYGIRIRLKIMTKPGEQFVVRRRAYALIKKAFEANGINFALPKVHVAGGDEDGRAAAAHEGLSVVQPPKSTSTA